MACETFTYQTTITAVEVKSMAESVKVKNTKVQVKNKMKDHDVDL